MLLVMSILLKTWTYDIFHASVGNCFDINCAYVCAELDADRIKDETRKKRSPFAGKKQVPVTMSMSMSIVSLYIAVSWGTSTDLAIVSGIFDPESVDMTTYYARRQRWTHKIHRYKKLKINQLNSLTVLIYATDNYSRLILPNAYRQ